METKQSIIEAFINREKEKCELTHERIEVFTSFLNQFTEAFIKEELLSNFITKERLVDYSYLTYTLYDHILDKNIKYNIFIDYEKGKYTQRILIDDGNSPEFGKNVLINQDGIYESDSIDSMLSLINIFHITSHLNKINSILDEVMSDEDGNILNLPLNNKVKDFINQLSDYYIEIIKDVKYFTPKGKKGYVKIYFFDEYNPTDKFEITVNL